MRCFYRPALVLLVVVTLLVLLPGSALGISGLTVEQIGNRLYAGEGYMETIGSMVFMHLKGDPYEIGLQHGTLLAHLVPEEYLFDMRDHMNPLAAEASGSDRLIQAFKQFYFRFKMDPWIHRNIPEPLYQELQGIVYGVSWGQDTDPLEIVMGNVSQDLGFTFGCTSMVAFGDATTTGSLYHARNLDNIAMVDFAQYGYVVVYEPDRGYPFITHVYPIHAGTMQAMNNQGISVSMNYSLVDRAENSLDGMGMVFLMRQIVQYASTLDEAIEIVLGTPRTFGINIIISDSKGPDAVVMEVDANRFAIRRAQDGVLYSANRYNSEYMQQFQTPGWLASARREERLAQFFEENYGSISVDSMVDLLRDRNQPGSVGHVGLVDGVNNAGSILSSVFSPDEQMVWISILDDHRGSPDTEFYAFSLARALAGEEPAVLSRNIAATQVDQNFTNWLLIRKATIAYSKNQLTATLEYLAQLDPEFSEVEGALNLKAHSHFRLGNLAQAQDYFQMIADLPHVAEPFYRLEALAILGAFHDSAGNRFAALESYEKAVNVEIPDLGGNTTFYRRLAQAGLQRPVYLEYNGSSYSFTSRDSAIGRFFRAPQAIPFTHASAYSQYEGMQIANVRILGVHQTNPTTVAQVIRLKPGSEFVLAQFQAAQRRLTALRAVDRATLYVVPVSDDQVDIVVRVSEGFGIYLDPVEFVIENILNLSQQTIAMRYYNVGGRLITVGGEYSFSGNNRRVAYLSLPLFSYPTTIRYQSQSFGTGLTWGEHSGSHYSIDRTDASISTQIPLGWMSHASLTAGYSKSDVKAINTTTGLEVPSNEYVTLATTIQTGLPGSTTWTQDGTNLQLTAAVLGNGNDLTEVYPRLQLRARNSTYLGGGFVSRLDLEFAWTQWNTPYDRRLRLGGNGQLGTNSPMFTGEIVAYSSLSLLRYFNPDLAAHGIIEVANIWEDGSRRDVSSLLYSIGGGLTYQTPIGLSVRAQYSKNLSLPGTHSFSFGIVSPF